MSKDRKKEPDLRVAYTSRCEVIPLLLLVSASTMAGWVVAREEGGNRSREGMLFSRAP
jgi:hypothetical protein